VSTGCYGAMTAASTLAGTAEFPNREVDLLVWPPTLVGSPEVEAEVLAVNA